MKSRFDRIETGRKTGLCSFCYEDCRFIDTRQAWLLKMCYHSRFHKAAYTKSVLTHPLYVGYVARRTGSRVVCDTSKSPRWALFLNRFVEWGLDIRYVFVIRDPRAVIASHIRKNRSIGDAIDKFTMEVDRIRELKERLGRHRFIDVRYESFVRKPEQELRKLCDFLGLEFEEAMLDYDQFEHHIIGGNDKARSRIKRENNQRINYRKSDIGWYLAQQDKFFIDDRWETELSRAMRARIESELEDELQWLGYVV